MATDQQPVGKQVGAERPDYKEVSGRATPAAGLENEMKRYVARESMAQWWVQDTEDKMRIVCMCPRKHDAKMIADALNSPNDQAHGRTIARPVERLVVPDFAPGNAPEKKLKKSDCRG